MLRGLAVGVGAIALWFAWQLTMEFFVAWYSGTEYENGIHSPWRLGGEIAAIALAGVAAVAFAVWPGCRRGDDDATDGSQQ